MKSIFSYVNESINENEQIGQEITLESFVQNFTNDVIVEKFINESKVCESGSYFNK